jgi:multidrug transporter EmrE-like cation transporter
MKNFGAQGCDDMGWIYVFLTIVLTVYGQLILKWHMDRSGPMPSEFSSAIGFLFRQLIYPTVLSSFGSAFLASLTWMAALSRFELGFVYPFMSLCFPLVMVFSALLLEEGLGWTKVVGTIVIVAGLLILSR